MCMFFALAKSKIIVRYFILVYYQGLMSFFLFSFNKLASLLLSNTWKAINPQDIPKHNLLCVFRVNHSCVCMDRISSLDWRPCM